MSQSSSPTIFLSAAEASGDTHAANLILALKARLPGARFVGVGGPRMAAAGCEVLEDVTAHASMVFGPLTKLGYFRGVIRQVAEAMQRQRPAVLVPVDSPALNWHTAAAARRLGVPVMYYIAPQVWAWGPWRVKKVRRLTDQVACILPFEQDYLRRRGVRATFVGHPLFDHVLPRERSVVQPPADGAWGVLMLPGSRPGEIRRHAGALAEAARGIVARFPAARCQMAVSDAPAAERLRRALGPRARQPGLSVEVGRTQELMNAAHLAVAKSGTVTLELAHFGLPMVVFYQATRAGYAMLRWWLFRTKHLSLVNILAGREMVPELMPWSGRPAELLAATLEMMEHPERLAGLSRELIALADPLRAPDGTTASANAAELVIQTMR